MTERSHRRGRSPGRAAEQRREIQHHADRIRLGDTLHGEVRVEASGLFANGIRYQQSAAHQALADELQRHSQCLSEQHPTAPLTLRSFVDRELGQENGRYGIAGEPGQAGRGFGWRAWQRVFRSSSLAAVRGAGGSRRRRRSTRAAGSATARGDRCGAGSRAPAPGRTA